MQPTQTNLTVRRVREILTEAARCPIFVAGDVMLDQFIWGEVSRISPEAPVPVVRFDRDEFRLGGAANVAANVAALGGQVEIAALDGAADSGRPLLDALSAAGIATQSIVTDSSRCTTRKLRLVTTRNQQVARIDYERDTDAGGEIEQALVAQVARLAGGARALLVSDYLKGAITRPVIEALLRAGTPLIVDPKIPHLACYAGATLVTPNHHEAEVATHFRIRTDADARQAARDFRTRAQCGGVLITRGEHGMWLSAETVEGSIPARAREVSDVTGAGDTVVATLALALAAGATSAEAAALANQAAGIVVGKFGPATLTAAELAASF